MAEPVTPSDETPYWKRSMQAKTRERVERAAEIVRAAGTTTIRQVSYRLYPDAHGKDMNRVYDRTVKDLVRARTKGLIPWDAIQESRVIDESNAGTGRDPETYLTAQVDRLAEGYRLDRTPAHTRPVVVTFEKDTMTPQFREVTRPLGVPFVCTRGQTPWTAKKKLADDLRATAETAGETPDVLHWGDNDDHGREIAETLQRDLAHLGTRARVEWAGVTADQETRFGLPPGARLDGFDPADLRDEIDASLNPYIDRETLSEIEAREAAEREELRDELTGLFDAGA